MKIDGNIDYSSYSLPELKEALSLIERENYPLNYKMLAAEIATRTGSSTSPLNREECIATTPSPTPMPSSRVESVTPYRPNSIPLLSRAFNIFASICLLAYGAHGIYTNDLYLPGKRGPGVHLHGSSALVMYAAFVCACLVMLSVVADHHDERNNEHTYRTFSQTLKVAAWSLFALSLLLYVFSPRPA